MNKHSIDVEIKIKKNKNKGIDKGNKNKKKPNKKQIEIKFKILKKNIFNRSIKVTITTKSKFYEKFKIL